MRRKVVDDVGGTAARKPGWRRAGTLEVVPRRAPLGALAFVMGATLAAGCNRDAPPPDPGKVVMPPMPPRTRASDLARVLPVTDAGEPILGEAHGIRLVLSTQPRVDPLSGRAVCLDLVANCSEANRGALDGCFDAVTACTSAEPWVEAEATPCCPRSCIDAYRGARRAGQTTLDALQQAFGMRNRVPDCYPGADAMTRRLQ